MIESDDQRRIREAQAKLDEAFEEVEQAMQGAMHVSAWDVGGARAVFDSLQHMIDWVRAPRAPVRDRGS